MPAPISAGAGVAGPVPAAASRTSTPPDTGQFATALTELLGELAGEPDRGTSGDAAGEPGTASGSGLFGADGAPPSGADGDGAVRDDPRSNATTRQAAGPRDASTHAFPYGATFAALVPGGPAPLELAGAAAASSGELALLEASTAGPVGQSTGLSTVAGSSANVPNAIVGQGSSSVIGQPGPAVGEVVGSVPRPSGLDVGPSMAAPSGVATTTPAPAAPAAQSAAAGGPQPPGEAIPQAANPWPARSASAVQPAAPAPETPAGAGVQPAVALQPVTGTSQPVAVAVPAGAQTLAAQLAPSIMTLAASAPGEHVLTIRVTPENLGPVTVRAHIGSDGVRIELFTPTEAGRAAVQSVLADLRRDLAGTGIGASLDLSHREAPAQDPTAREGTGHGGAHGQRSEASGPVLRTAPDVPRPERTTPLTSPTTVRLDVFV